MNRCCARCMGAHFELYSVRDDAGRVHSVCEGCRRAVWARDREPVPSRGQVRKVPVPGINDSRRA